MTFFKAICLRLAKSQFQYTAVRVPLYTKPIWNKSQNAYEQEIKKFPIECGIKYRKHPGCITSEHLIDFVVLLPVENFEFILRCVCQFQCVFRLAKSGRKVLYISAKSPESLPMDDEYDEAVYRDVLRNTTFSYSSDPMKLIDFFLDMRSNVQPKYDCIVIDFLHTFFDYFPELDVDLSLHTHFMECHMLMTATLLSTVDTYSNVDTSSTSTQFISIVCIDPQCHSIYDRFIQTYVDLFYYKFGSILSFEQLMEKFPHQPWIVQEKWEENSKNYSLNC